MSKNKKIRVLYIEDDPGHAHLLIKRLEKRGGEYIIDWVDDAMEGLKKVKQEPGYYDVVLVDYNLKGKSGIEVLRQIKTYESAPPTVMITASGSEEVAVNALQSGASNYLIKDIDFNYLELLPIVICETISKCRLEEDMKKAEEEIRKLSTAVEQSPGMVIIIDTEGNIEYVNPKFTKVTGYTPEEVIGKKPNILESESEPKEHYAQLWNTLTSGKEWCGEFYDRKKNGETYWSLISISPIKNSAGKIIHYVSMQEDISERKRQEELIQHMAYHDSLTGLPNRRTFFDRLSVEIAEAKRYKQKFAVIFIDLDNFKEINDSLGHEIGDKVLQNVTREMSKHLRESDTLARTGGDEFILLIPKIKKTEAAQTVAEKFLETFQKPLIIDNHEIPIGLSMGASFYPKNGKEPDILVKKADEAMYKAKQSGRNNFKIS